VAQDVQKILPSVVGEHSGYLNVNYDAFIALLTEALKEQQTQIESQEARSDGTAYVSERGNSRIQVFIDDQLLCLNIKLNCYGIAY